MKEPKRNERAFPLSITFGLLIVALILWISIAFVGTQARPTGGYPVPAQSPSAMIGAPTA